MPLAFACARSLRAVESLFEQKIQAGLNLVKRVFEGSLECSTASLDAIRRSSRFRVRGKDRRLEGREPCDDSITSCWPSVRNATNLSSAHCPCLALSVAPGLGQWRRGEAGRHRAVRIKRGEWVEDNFVIFIHPEEFPKPSACLIFGVATLFDSFFSPSSLLSPS